MTADVRSFNLLKDRAEKRVESGGEPPDNELMEARVAKLEEFAEEAKVQLARIETKIDASATKAEVHDLKAELIKWVVGTALGLGAVGITVMTFVLNNATPKSPPAPPPVMTAPAMPPIIINVPPAASSAPAPAAKRP